MCVWWGGDRLCMCGGVEIGYVCVWWGGDRLRVCGGVGIGYVCVVGWR